MTPPTALDARTQRRAKDLFTEQHRQLLVRTDRMFAWLMLSQWLVGIVLALTVSPNAWSGTISSTHPHVWAAIFLGGSMASIPVLLAFGRPGAVVTRHMIAAGQMLSSALLIHLTGGRIETHFHVFGSLAFLAFYRDWRVLLTATIVVALDHYLRGAYWPESVFGILNAGPWRWIEHAAWVLFEDGFLIASVRQSRSEMRAVAERQAVLEATNRDIELQVTERTADLTQEIAVRKRAEEELRAKHAEVQAVHDCSPLGVARTDECGQWVYVNRVLLDLAGIDMQELLPTGWQQAVHPEDRARVVQQWEAAVQAREPYSAAYRMQHRSGETVWVSVKAAPILRDLLLLGYIATVEDITERKRVESELDLMNRRVIEASRQAGMAEVATGVLHNVGNVLNSVNVSASLISDRVGRSKAKTLARVMETVSFDGGDLRTFLQDDPRGPQLPSLLHQLSDHLATDQDTLLDEVGSLKKNIEHIKEIVTMQQSYARVAGVTEPVNVPELIKDVIRLNDSSLQRHAITIIEDLSQDLPTIITDKHKVLQILVNLVRNAKYACVESACAPKEIRLQARNASHRLVISVLDNGIGIPPENLTKIFNHGFTTRKQGHGFGLHSGALAAKELGGSLHASSQGLGSGATFALELPLHPLETIL